MFFQKAQGSVEYLVIIGIVVVLALVVVGLVVSQSNFSSSQKGISTLSTASLPLSLVETAMNPDGNVFIRISNNTGENITIKRVYVNGLSEPFFEFVGVGEKKSLVLNSNVLCSSGSETPIEIELDYETPSGLAKKQFYPQAISFSCENVSASEGIVTSTCLQGETKYHNTLCLSGVVGYWSFDEDFNFPSGQVGKGIGLDGSGDYVNVPDNPVLNFTNNSFSISLWAKYTRKSSVPFPSLIFKGAGINSANNYFVGILDNNPSTTNAKWWIKVNGSNGVQKEVQTGVVDENQWYQVVMVVDRDTNLLKLYSNGALLGSISIATVNSILTSSYPLKIGKGVYDFNGSIDEILIFNRALSLVEIANIYQAGLNGQHNSISSGLVGEWDFEGNFLDSSGNGNKGTPLGNLVQTVYDSSNLPNNGTYYGDAFVSSSSAAYGNALVLDGNGDYLSMGNKFALDTFSIAAWVNCVQTDDPNNNYITTKFDQATDGQHIFRIKPTGILDFIIRINSSDYIELTTVPNAITEGEWHHVVVTTQSGSQTMYIDGVDVNSSSVSYPSLMITSDHFNIGSRDNRASINYDFNGLIDEVVIFNKVLSADEVLEIYNGRPN